LIEYEFSIAPLYDPKFEREFDGVPPDRSLA
jgi:hypothetical protein